MNTEFYTLALVIITVLVTMLAFNDQGWLNKLIFWPARMQGPAEYYRFLTNGFIHADWQHLIFNMLTLYLFGRNVEIYYRYLGNGNLYLVMYLSAIIISSLPAYFKHRRDGYYRSLGASGGVSAVVFSAIYFNPWAKIIIFVLPLWSIIYAVLYIVYTVYMARQRRDNINHDAHLWGAVYGFVFTWLTEPTHGRIFLEQLKMTPF